MKVKNNNCVSYTEHDTSQLDFIPSCSHGPVLLLQKLVNGKPNEEDYDDQFFICAASRDSSQCKFYLRWEDYMYTKKEKIIAEHMLHLKPIKLLPYRRGFLLSCPATERCFCCTCQSLLHDDRSPRKRHLEDNPSGQSRAKRSCLRDHVVTRGLSGTMLGMPTLLLSPAKCNKSNAQYFFSRKTTLYLCRAIQKMEFTHVLCVGAPRLHEFLRLLRRKKGSKTRSFLLDMDPRFGEFFRPSVFTLYNMLNGYFFDSEGEKSCRGFLTLAPSDKLLIFCDPPFGALLKPLGRVLESLKRSVLKEAVKDSPAVTTTVVLPYFLGPKLQEFMPHLRMLDYKVTYENHSRLDSSESSAGRRDSVVRLFTDHPARDWPPPDTVNYKFCKDCDRYTHVNNAHCSKCDMCTTFHGATYRHCDICARCTKPNKYHCSKCGYCVLEGHPCPSKQ